MATKDLFFFAEYPVAWGMVMPFFSKATKAGPQGEKGVSLVAISL
jgi:hypothetical protein